MRTTLALDDELLAAARALADAEQRTLGEVISDLARRGLEPRADAISQRRDFPVFAVPIDASPITPEAVATALDEEP